MIFYHDDFLSWWFFIMMIFYHASIAHIYLTSIALYIIYVLEVFNMRSVRKSDLYEWLFILMCVVIFMFSFYQIYDLL